MFEEFNYEIHFSLNPANSAEWPLGVG